MLVDFREERSKVPGLLRGFNIPIQITDLAVDYVINKNCFIERKTVSDFINSVEDRRLFKQITFISANCSSPLLILEGDNLYQSGRMKTNCIRGLIAWISITKKVPVIQTVDEEDTAKFIRILVRKYGEKINLESDVPSQKRITKISVKSNWQRQIEILVQIPGIGRQTAKDLLKSFGSISNVTLVSDAELLGVPNLGKDRLSSIRQIFPQIIRDNSL